MPFNTINNVYKNVKQVDEDLSQGHVSVQETSKAVNDIKKTWDDFAKIGDYRDKYGNKQNKLADFAKKEFVPGTFDAFGGIKNGAATGISSVSSFFSAVDSFKGSWRNPEQARQKLEDGLKQISNGVKQFGETLKNISRAGKGISDMLGTNSKHPILDGIGSFGNGTSVFGENFGNSGIPVLAGITAGGISKKVNNSVDGVLTGGAAPISLVENDTSIYDTKSNKLQEKTAINSNTSLNNTDTKTDFKTDSDDFSADMIHEINVILDGNYSQQNSICSINGNKYKLSEYSLSQELLRPMILNFSLEKNEKIETQSDVVFADITQIIGKTFEINVSTVKTSIDESSAQPQKAFEFKGMIIDVSASRNTASTQYARVTVASMDVLLQNAPHCRSFENMTLADIVTSVLNPYKGINGKINPRFKEKIPYIVQYNQTDYAFISMLAVRFGEWMYSTGKDFVFGELITNDSSTATLEYPGGSLMSYNLYQNMASFSFNHFLPDHYQFGKENSFINESGRNIADNNVNDWTDKAYYASQQRYNNENITVLSTGGFDNGSDGEGIDTILDYSVKLEAEGKKTGMMTVNGFSKLALLKIGQTFLIRDKVQNKSGESKDVEQKALKIIGINHSFDYQQEYSNIFTAIPVACNFPSYSDANVYPICPPQRAKVVENEDKQKLGRIRVQFPWQEAQNKEMKTPWLRIAVPYSGQGKGCYFIPEIGEEVMVGFEMNNAERPYIIGTFFNGGNGKPDEKWTSTNETPNNIKAIRSRNGHTILFNDQGEAGLLEIYDNKGNTYHITLSADDKKITIHSAGKIEIIADSDINIKSKGNISMEANQEVSIQASKVKVR